MANPIDTEVLRQWVGRTEVVSDLITPELVRRFRATLDQPPGDLSGGAEAPLALHWCLAPAAAPASALGPDGHPARGGFLPPVPLPRRMWAGGELKPGVAARIGDEIRRESRIEDVALKTGRSGPLCFVTVRHVFSGPAGVVMDERQDIVYRDLASAAPPQERPALSATRRKGVVPDTTLLFRYSALTFNGHRIHYDDRYCREQEGYPGLVVHGPLMATLLFQFAAEILGATPASFTFRSRSPVFDGGEITLNARPVSGHLSLWVADQDGVLAMEAQASGT